MVDVYGFLIVEWIFFLLLAIYCELVVPDGIGVKQHPLFFLERRWWSRLIGSQNTTSLTPSPEENESEEVSNERKKVWQDVSGSKYVIKMLDLHKDYGNKVAVKNLSMGIENLECFGLLGPNGSGKSTTVNILCGYFSPTKGTALIRQMDIRTDIDLVHLIMGVCPQENIIWEDLTGKEHLNFYGRLKNLSGSTLDAEVAYRLKQVDLYNVRNKKAGKYSGGMKRRLCVAMSLVGRPEVILMDEPSTGLDPKARTNLWSVIRTAKKKSCLLLTTHSMEEAEALCDRVGIFVNGEMKSIGAPALLKSKFGDNFKLTISTSSSEEPKLTELVKEKFPQSILFNSPVSGTRIYQLPRSQTKLSEVFAAVKLWGDQVKMTDWGISNVTLEEVFLQIALSEEETKNESFKENDI